MYCFLQSISPGLVEDDILIQLKPHDLVKYMPKLTSRDIADAVKFIITREAAINVIFIGNLQSLPLDSTRSFKNF